MSVIIKYPKIIEIPSTRNDRGDLSINYSRFVGFSLEDEESQINWYFVYKKSLKKLVIFKEMKAVKEILKHEIPTARTIGGVDGFLKELKKIGIDACIKKGEL